MLRAAGWLYGKIADIRNSLYDRGIFKSHSLGARTISIGNITTGGTGKTPLVAYVAEILAEVGEKVCILTRGYGRESTGRILVSDGEKVLVDARTGGDEPVELARKLIGRAIVVADADRVAAAKWAKEKFAVTVFVLDDGFQHRRAKRDLDIVCVDSTNPWGELLPTGQLREPFTSLVRADCIVLTRCELVASTAFLKSWISNLNPTAKLFEARSRINSAEILSRNQDSEIRGSMERNAQVFAFCGLANPDAFFRSLGQEGYAVRGTKALLDHHRYTQTDISVIEAEARQVGASALITTAKDGVKLARLKFKIPCYVAEAEMTIDDRDAFHHLVTS